MQIPIEEITNGSRDGQKVWVTDFRYSDYSNKPARNIAPTLCEVVPEKQSGKTVYFSDSALVKLLKDGRTRSKTVYAPYDPTSNRRSPGVPLAVFDNWQDCFTHHRTQTLVVIEGLTAYRDMISERIEQEIQRLRESTIQL